MITLIRAIRLWQLRTKWRLAMYQFIDQQAKELLKKPYSEETIKALKLYNSKGLEFVKNSAKQIKDENGISYILHTKFEIIRNKLGKIKDYKLLDVRFLPASGKKNPLERLG